MGDVMLNFKDKKVLLTPHPLSFLTIQPYIDSLSSRVCAMSSSLSLPFWISSLIHILLGMQLDKL